MYVQLVETAVALLFMHPTREHNSLEYGVNDIKYIFGILARPSPRKSHILGKERVPDFQVYVLHQQISSKFHQYPKFGSCWSCSTRSSC